MRANFFFGTLLGRSSTAFCHFNPKKGGSACQFFVAIVCLFKVLGRSITDPFPLGCAQKQASFFVAGPPKRPGIAFKLKKKNKLACSSPVFVSDRLVPFAVPDVRTRGDPPTPPCGCARARGLFRRRPRAPRALARLFLEWLQRHRRQLALAVSPGS